MVWCPFQLGDMRVIKKVQRCATKIAQSLIKDKSYYDHLVSLNLPSLLYRRRMEVIVVYLIVKGLKRILFDRPFTYCDLPTRSNCYKLYKNHYHPNVKKILFSKGINDWNSLPRDVIESLNLII